jgi:uncharacterized protein YlxP (DUF503 family)
MHIGLLQVNLHLPGIVSLKGKRQIIKSLKDRVRQQANVSIAETGSLDAWQESQLAVVTVSSDSARVSKVLDSVVKIIQNTPGAELTDYQIEML